MHKSVLLKEAIEALHIKNQAKYIDATLGAGGHTIEIVKAGGVVLGIDDDAFMLKLARKSLNKACPAMNRSIHGSAFKLIHGSFRNIDELAKKTNFSQVNGILFDLGISNIHFSSKKRGFSFQHDKAELDMRINKKAQKVKALDLLNVLDKKQLKRVFRESMEVHEANGVVKLILLFRNNKIFETVGDFLEALAPLRSRGKTHPATKAFLALRIAVNSELDSLRGALPKAFSLLTKRGRLVVISFHSGEDRVVKDYFKNLETKGDAKVITKKPITPTEEEIDKNRKARSAKMRVIEKI